MSPPVYLKRRLFFRNGSYSEPISRCLTSKLRFTKIMNAWIKSFILFLLICCMLDALSDSLSSCA